MSRRTSLIVVGFLAAALVGVALLALPGSPVHKSPTLGLDLQGGLEVTLQAVPPPDRDLTEQDLDRSVDIMRNRVDKLGVTEPEIRKQGSDQIVIQLPGVKDPQAAAEIIGKTAQLELYDLETSLTGPSVSIRGEPVEFASLYDLLARVQSQAAQGTASAYYVFNKNTKRLVDGPFDTKAAAEKVANKRPNARQVLAVPDKMVVVTCGENAVVCPGGPQGSGVAPDRTYYYLFKYEPPDIPQMTGEDLKLDGTRADFDTSARRRRTADRDHGVHRQGRGQVRGDHARRVDARPHPPGGAALRDRPRPRDPNLPADRLRRTARSRAASAAAGRRSRGSTRSARPRTSRSSSRQAHSRSTSRRSRRTTSRRRSGRTRSRRQSAPRSAD